MEQIRLGIIGYGNMGSGHVKNILGGKCPHVCLAAIADRKPERRAAAEALGSGAKIFDEGSKLIESGCVDSVLIAVPHYQHPVLAIQAFGKGLNVMCEKPAGVYTKAVREMNAAAAASGKTFGMMFNQRTNCLYRKMHEMVQGGQLGKLMRVNWIITDWYRTQSYYDSGEWRATWNGEGGGVLLNQCPHQLDLLQWICGMPKQVTAFMEEGKWHHIEVEDDVTAFLRFEGGATGVFITTTGDTPGTNRFEITGELGKLVCENNELTFWRLAENEREFCMKSPLGFNRPECTVEKVETDGKNPQHVGVLNAFAEHILFGSPLVAPGEEGIRSLTLSNAMHLSSWLGRTVDIPFDEDLFLAELNKRRAASRRKEGVKEQTADVSGTFGSKPNS
jgi:predicted dehydrogenase